MTLEEYDRTDQGQRFLDLVKVKTFGGVQGTQYAPGSFRMPRLCKNGIPCRANARALDRSREVKLDERLGSVAEVTVLVPLNPN